MRTIEEANVNARVPDLFCESLLNLRVRITDILQISETENYESRLETRWTNRHDRYLRKFSISIPCRFEEGHGVLKSRRTENESLDNVGGGIPVRVRLLWCLLGCLLGPTALGTTIKEDLGILNSSAMVLFFTSSGLSSYTCEGKHIINLS